VPAKLFITLVVMAGLGTLIYGGIHQSSRNIAEFICYLGIAIPCVRLGSRGYRRCPSAFPVRHGQGYRARLH
jgi:hypothetical protein